MGRILGSSPLARDLPSHQWPALMCAGIIPARAGFTRRARRSATSPPGSSPLARGLRVQQEDRRGARGIIPARAGFTSHVVAVRAGRPGSSPLARGLPPGDGVGGRDLGIIPARAGFTKTPQPKPSRNGDHPRSRGVYASPSSAGHTSIGSSPLARGLLSAMDALISAAGIIPARAGFTLGPGVLPAGHEDHPRSRGVYLATSRSTSSAHGSSPLARGLPLMRRTGRAGERIIPARAGFTGPVRDHPSPGGDHPRSRGVYRRI